MGADMLWRLWLQFISLTNELKLIFPSKVRIFTCSSDGQKSYCWRTFYQQIHFISQQFTWKVGRGNSQIWDRFDGKCQIWRHASSPCFTAVLAAAKLYSITHKSMCNILIFSSSWFASFITKVARNDNFYQFSSLTRLCTFTSWRLSYWNCRDHSVHHAEFSQ